MDKYHLDSSTGKLFGALELITIELIRSIKLTTTW